MILQVDSHPICSVYGIFTFYIYHAFKPNVGKYTISVHDITSFSHFSHDRTYVVRVPDFKHGDVTSFTTKPGGKTRKPEKWVWHGVFALDIQNWVVVSFFLF